RLAAARVLGYRIVWTIHQVYPHERVGRRLERAGVRVLARASSALIAHDLTTQERARAELGGRAADVRIVPHGTYSGVYRAGRSRTTACPGCTRPATSRCCRAATEAPPARSCSRCRSACPLSPRRFRPTRN